MSGAVAALYDVHGNVAALDAALAAAEASLGAAPGGAAAGLLVFGGDLVPGPQPAETIDRVMALGARARCLRGNGDRVVVDAFDGRVSERLPPDAREVISWTAARLERRHRDFLAALPATLTVPVTGLGDVLFCHATPRSDEEIFTVRTPDERVRTLLGDVPQSVVVCGHTHMQFDRQVGGTRVVNAGSVGMPFGAPGAYWLRLGPDVRLERAEYEAGELVEPARRAGYPLVGDLTRRPSEEEALRLFAPRE